MKHLKQIAMPIKILVLLLISTFSVELLIMTSLFQWTGLQNATLLSILDSLILILILYPVLYFSVYRPLTLEISRRKQSEEDLKQIFESSPYAILAIIDQSGNIIRVNRQTELVFGYQPDELIGQKIEILVPEQLRKIHLEHRSNYMQAPTARQLGVGRDLMGRRKDGTEVPIEISLTPIKTTRGMEILATVTDITVRKKIEGLVKESEKHYHSLFDHMRDGFAHCQILYDDQGTPMDFIYLEVNRSFERLTGLKDVVGKKISEVIPGIQKSNPELLEIYGRVASTGSSEKFETEVKPLGIWFSISVYSTKRDHFVAVFDNITKRKTAEQERDQALQAREEMIAVVSHEIKNPITAIGTSLQIIRKTMPAHEGLAQKEKLFLQIQYGINRINRITSDLLDVTRIESGRLLLEYKTTPIADLVDHVVQSFQQTAAQKQVHLEQKVPQNVPSLNCDAERIEQVLANLLGNALKFTPKGGSVHVEVEQLPDKILFQVRDTGSGISENDQPHLFERFWQAKDTLYAGTGLGLYIAKNIVTAHGGEISVESRIAHGSTFSFSLPVGEQVS